MTPFDRAGRGRTLTARAVRIDGRAVAADGSWPGFRPATGVSANGVRLTLVAGEAAVVTLSPPRPPSRRTRRRGARRARRSGDGSR